MKRWRSFNHWIESTRPSQLPVHRDVTGNTNDIIVLNYIENMFKTYTQVLESDCSQEFATLDTIPDILNPKHIVQKMVQRFLSNVARVYREPDFTQTIIFTFNDDGHERKFIFSNCMKFNEDVSVICFLHHITILNSLTRLTNTFERIETVQILTKLMRNKYGIDFDHEFLPIENKFTMSIIAQCFPSITWDMIHNNYKTISFFISLIDYSMLFPDFDLPKTIFIPLIVLVLPKLEDPPIAILVAVSIKLRDFYAPVSTPKYPLDLTYDQIFHIYNCTIIPERLKLELCTKWNIVEKQNDAYKFAPCLAAHRLKAKCLLSQLRPSDPQLKDILSKI